MVGDRSVKVRTKSCHACKEAKEVLYRCRYQDLRDWVFLCRTCLTPIKTGFDPLPPALLQIILHLIVGILALGDPCVEAGLSEKQCHQQEKRGTTPLFWLARFTKAQTMPMTVVLAASVTFSLCKILLPGTIKQRFDRVSLILDPRRLSLSRGRHGWYLGNQPMCSAPRHSWQGPFFSSKVCPF